jgi:hypothetical protein
MQCNPLCLGIFAHLAQLFQHSIQRVFQPANQQADYVTPQPMPQAQLY